MREKASGPFGVRVILLVALLSWPSNASATSLALASVTLDWSGLTVSIGGNLSLTIVPGFGSADSVANTDVFGDPHTVSSLRDSKAKSFQTGAPPGPDDWADTSALLPSVGPGGIADAQATTANGFVTSNATATFSDLGLLGGAGFNYNYAEALARTQTFAFSVAGTGTGTVSISIPYTLSVLCHVSDDGTANASALIGVDTVAMGRQFIIRTCNGTGSFSEAGTIALSTSYTFPGSSFPYVPGAIGLVGHTEATAGTIRVPEPSAALLVLLGGFTGLALRRLTQSVFPSRRPSSRQAVSVPAAVNIGIPGIDSSEP